MRKQGQGVIVNVTSSVAIGVMPLVAIYAASKFAIEGLTESMAYELEGFNIKARLVEPGYAPTTNFTANGSARMQGLIPADYASFAQACFARMANYPTAYCTEAEVAEAVLAAATEDGVRIRYPAGADSKMLAELRWSTSEHRYLQRMRNCSDQLLHDACESSSAVARVERSATRDLVSMNVAMLAAARENDASPSPFCPPTPLTESNCGSAPADAMLRLRHHLSGASLHVRRDRLQPDRHPPRTDPQALGLMQGFPPPSNKTITFHDGSFRNFPELRWAWSNIRQLVPTVNVWRGAGPASVLPREEHDIGTSASVTMDGRPMTLRACSRRPMPTASPCCPGAS